MKRFIAVCLVAVMCMTFCGCKKEQISVTSEQNDLIAEYIAGTLLKYSYDNEWKYQKLNASLYGNKIEKPTLGNKPSDNTPSTPANNPTAPTKPAIVGNDKPQGNTDIFASLPDVLGLSGAAISYSGYVVGESYPVGSYVLTVPAENGCKIVAVEFVIKNNTSSVMVANTSGRGNVMKLSVGGSNPASQVTMLKNDLLNLNNVSIQAGSEYKAFVLFQVNENLIEGIAGSVVTLVSSGSQVGSFPIQ